MRKASRNGPRSESSLTRRTRPWGRGKGCVIIEGQVKELHGGVRLDAPWCARGGRKGMGTAGLGENSF